MLLIFDKTLEPWREALNSSCEILSLGRTNVWLLCSITFSSSIYNLSWDSTYCLDLSATIMLLGFCSFRSLTMTSETCSARSPEDGFLSVAISIFSTPRASCRPSCEQKFTFSRGERSPLLLALPSMFIRPLRVSRFDLIWATCISFKLSTCFSL